MLLVIATVAKPWDLGDCRVNQNWSAEPIIAIKYKKPFSYNMKTVENEASGIRTPDNLIKSQVLYRLS